MSVFNEVAKELFGDPDERGTFGLDFTSNYRNYDGEPMTLNQLKRIQETDPYWSGNPNGIRSHPEYDYLYECLETIEQKWPRTNILMKGRLGTPDAWGVETVYIFYDQVQEQDDFEEWAVLSFESWLGEEKKGVKPTDSRITFENENFRYPESDDFLLMTTDECHFREHDTHGKYLRLWWDD